MMHRPLIFILWLAASVALGVDPYWVSTNGAAGSWAAAQSATPLSGAACASLATFEAASEAVGDTIYFRGGTYVRNINASLFTPAVSGTAASNITFSAYNSESVIFTNVNAGVAIYEVSLNNRDWIVIDGFEFVDFPRHVLISNGSDNNIVRNCIIYRTTIQPPSTVGRGIQIRGNTTASTNNWILNNVIHGFWLEPCEEYGDGIMIGDTGSDFDSNYNTIESNTVYNVGHAVTANFTQYNVWRGNYFHNEGFKEVVTNITGTATGGSSTTMIDTSKDFLALGVMDGTFLWLHNLDDPGSGQADRARIEMVTFTLSGTANATVFAVYSNNTYSFTVLATIAGGSTLVTSGDGPAGASGTLTKLSGTGDATIDFDSRVGGIKTTTNPNDTLEFTSGSGTPTFSAGHSYSIGCGYFFDANPPGNGLYGHRAAEIDSKSGQRGSANDDNILFEGNRSAYASSNPNNDGPDGLSLSAGQCIIRYNAIFGNAGPGIYFKNGIVASSNRVYNNTIYSNGLFSATQFPNNPITLTGVQLTSLSLGNAMKNNIIYGNVGGDFSTSIPAHWTVTNNHLAADGDPLFINADITTPTNAVLPDLALQTSSPARDAGSFLTTAAGAGTNSTTLIVDDSLYFQDGTWGSTLANHQADVIAVGTVGNTSAVSSINYATDTLTLGTAISWANSASVWLYSRNDGTVVLVGSAPDQGAHEWDGYWYTTHDPSVSGMKLSGP